MTNIYTKSTIFGQICLNYPYFWCSGNTFSSILLLYLQKHNLILTYANKLPKILIKSWNIYQKFYFLSKFVSFAQPVSQWRLVSTIFTWSYANIFDIINKKIIMKYWAFGEINTVKLNYPVFQGKGHRFLSILL